MNESSRRAAEFQKGKIPGWKWAVVWLMFLATLINYMDRQTVGLTSSHVMKEFNLDEKGYGVLESWFGISFAVLQFPAGILADRLSLRWLYAIALLVWSAAGFSTGHATTFTALAVCRLVLGIGESFNWPCAVAVIRRLIPRESRSVANGIFHAGASIGAAITPVIVTGILAYGYSWRVAFQVTGSFGLVWAIVWFWCIRGDRAKEVSHSEEEKDSDEESVPFLHIFFYRQFWITLAVGIAINITWHVYRVWLPRLLENEKIGLNYPEKRSRWIQTGFYVFADLGCMLAGYMARRLSRSGYSVERSRALVMLGTSMLCMLSVFVPYAHDPYIFVPLVFLVGAGAMGGFAGFYTLSQEISPKHTGKCLGLIGGIVWFVLSPLHTFIGALVMQYQTFIPVFVAVAFIPMIGSILCLFWKENQTKVEPLIPVVAEA